jgi:PDZ domain-containing protein
VAELREKLASNGVDEPVTVEIVRGGETLSLEMTPRLSEGADPAPVLGVGIRVDFEFPFDVNIQLENIGGPSAGMMFALGIIDTLTPGPLTGGERIAGTGTITAEGVVGGIGGIRRCRRRLVPRP